jgi:(p)ppGpp synthase/HD superfamily hydrolase
MRSPEVDKQIEEAIKFLVFAFQKSGHNPKPVVLHSIRVGLHLYNLGYAKNIVIAAVLHDVLEDTDVKIEEVKLKFGENVARLVEARALMKVFKIKMKDTKKILSVVTKLEKTL